MRIKSISIHSWSEESPLAGSITFAMGRMDAEEIKVALDAKAVQEVVSSCAGALERVAHEAATKLHDAVMLAVVENGSRPEAAKEEG